MANVLGELFQDIADAIRSKTGETGTMTPAGFPSGIRSIPLVINGAGVETDGNLKIAYGAFFAGNGENNVRQTVTHGLGEVPDFVFVYFGSAQTTEMTDDTVHLVSAWGMNSKFAPLGSGAGLRGAFAAHGCYVNRDSGTPSLLAVGEGGGTLYGMDQIPDTTNFDYFPWIATPDENTFEVGTNAGYPFWPGGMYWWIAMSDLGGTAENAENLSF